MAEELIRKGPHVPTEERALARLKHVVEIGDLEKAKKRSPKTLRTLLVLPNETPIKLQRVEVFL